MTWLSDETVSRLRAAGVEPDLSGTRYRLVERLGRGGMGTVYLAEDALLERRVALKVLDLPDSTGELAERLLREARILAKLEHPGIVPVHDVGTLADGRVFYTMKYVEGQRLDRYLARLESIPDRLRLFQRICEPVAFAHSRAVLHRDLKPENVMVGPFGEVLVMDWGVAKILRTPSEESRAPQEQASSSNSNQVAASPGPRSETSHGAVLGTPGYMAPEQARGEIARLDQRADIFSLGAILVFLLTGRQPEEIARVQEPDGHSPRLELLASGSGERIARPLAAVCDKSMSADPAARYGQAEELEADVARYLDGLPVTAYPEGILERLTRWSTKYRVAIALVLTYLLVRVLILFFLRR
jgi:serine/threonine protein kinase